MDDLFTKLTEKKRRLDRMRPLSPEQLAAINDFLDIEYTYTSNWIAGNTLSRQETAQILKKYVDLQKNKNYQKAPE